MMLISIVESSLIRNQMVLFIEINVLSISKDLPDELLMFIFKQMNNVEVLYSLFGVNERLDSLGIDNDAEPGNYESIKKVSLVNLFKMILNKVHLKLIGILNGQKVLINQ